MSDPEIGTKEEPHVVRGEDHGQEDQTTAEGSSGGVTGKLALF